MHWIYKGKKIKNTDDLPQGTFGFVYLITHKSGLKYIGKKQLFYKNSKPSKWEEYVGSNDAMKTLLMNGSLNDFKREILVICKTKRDLTYQEVKSQFLYEVLENPDFANKNIAGRYFL